MAEPSRRAVADMVVDKRASLTGNRLGLANYGTSLRRLADHKRERARPIAGPVRIEVEGTPAAPSQNL